MKGIIFATVLTALLAACLSVSSYIEPVRATGTIYIRADGSIDPPNVPISTLDNVTYTFTEDINGSLVVERDYVTINGAGHLLQGSGSGKGISLYSRTYVSIINAKITSFDLGLYLEYCSHVAVYSSTIAENDWSNIQLESSRSNVFSRNNVIASHGSGLWIRWGSSGNTVSENNITDNGSAAVSIENSGYNTVCKNSMINNTYGVLLVSSSSHNSVFENLIRGSEWSAMYIHTSSSNSFYHNTLLNNVRQVYTYDSINTWDYSSEGNYWIDYTGSDLDENGIGDIPYFIDSNNTDHYPLMHPYRSVQNLHTHLFYMTIQSAINAPETIAGNKIFVKNGTYYEHVVVNKAISLLGESNENTIINGNYSGLPLTITCDNVTISGFTICNSYAESTNRLGGINIVSSSNCSITDNIVENNLVNGISLGNSSGENEVSVNIVRNNALNGIHLYRACYSNAIFNNTIQGNSYDGIFIWNSCLNNSVHHNLVIEHPAYGIYVKSSSNFNTIADNDVIANGGSAVLIESSEFNLICNNRIVSNLNSWSESQGAIWLYDSASNNTFCANKIERNSVGIYFSDSCVSNHFYHNDLINNTVQLSYIHGNLWDNGYEGNYWSDYNGTDVDADGVGDTELPWSAVDNFPLMNPYWTPADMNHDLTVDIIDVVRICLAYGATPSDPHWNPHADIVEPFGIIDILDIVTCTIHYGEEYP